MHRQLKIITSCELARALAGVLGLGIFLLGCSPTVKVEAPDKPITINLNVKIEHQIRVKVDKELENVFSANSGLF